MTNKEVAEAFAENSCCNTRSLHMIYNSQSGIIYSYGMHFPIAKRMYREGKDDLIIFTTLRYSQTTARHKSLVLIAIGNIPCEIKFVDNVEGYSEVKYEPQRDFING